MSQLAHNSSSAKFALLNDIEIIAERNYEFSENDLTNMDMLEEIDLIECVVKATIQGREALVRTLMDRVGPVEIVVTGNNKDSLGYSVNGHRMIFDIPEFASHATSPKALKSLFKMIDEYGMKGFVEPGNTFPLLMQKVDYSRFLPKHNISKFDGLLPELVGGVLRQPELAIALHDESSRVSTPDAYKSMLCWATDQMVQDFPKGLAPLLPFQEVDGHGSMSMWKAGAGQPDNMSFFNIEVGMGATEGCSQAIRPLFSAMAPEVARLGFRDEQGRVLCETTTDFLLEFPAKACDEDNLDAATRFVATYCPIEVMAVQAAAACHRDFGLIEKHYQFTHSLNTRMTTNFDPLFRLLHRAHPLCERAKDLMTKEQWEGLLIRAESPSPYSLVGLYQTFGIDNARKRLKFSFGDFEVLVQGGYRFSDDTKVYENPTQYWAHGQKGQIEDLSALPPVLLNFTGQSFTQASVDTSHQSLHSFVVNVYKNVLKTNLWPASGQSPEDITTALKMASRMTLSDTKNTKSMALEAYLVNAGLDACLEVAKTPNQWITLTQVFSADDLLPYVKTMPSQARGRMLEIGMGL